MSESLGAGGDKAWLYDELGLSEYYGIEDLQFKEHPILNEFIKSEPELWTKRGFVAFFDNRDYKGSPVEGYSDLAKAFLTQADEIIDDIVTSEHRGPVSSALTIAIKPDLKREVADFTQMNHREQIDYVSSFATDRLYDFEDRPGSVALVGAMLHVTHCNVLGSFYSKDLHESTVYVGEYASTVTNVSERPYIVEMRGVDGIGEFVSYEIRTDIPPEMASQPKQPALEKNTEPSSPEVVFRQKAVTITDSFDVLEKRDSRFSGYKNLAKSAVINVVRILNDEDPSQAPTSYLPLELKPKVPTLNEAAVRRLGAKERARYERSIQPGKLYKDEDSSPANFMITMTHELLENPTMLDLTNEELGIGRLLTHGNILGREICFEEEFGSDELGIYKRWRVHHGLPEDLLVRVVTRASLPSDQQQRIMEKFLEEIDQRTAVGLPEMIAQRFQAIDSAIAKKTKPDKG